ncbi:MAG: DUF3303 domain-containing protein [Acidimicrobiales bacterium]|jgi:hypothetical protein
MCELMEFTQILEIEGGCMRFMVEYTITPEARNEVQALFKATGAMPPAGVELLGRWHDAASLKGYMLCETVDPVGIAVWLQDWTHMMTFNAVSVVDDEQMAGVIS